MEALGLLGMSKIMETPADFILLLFCVILLTTFIFTIKSKPSASEVGEIVEEKMHDKLLLLKTELIMEIRLIRHDVNSLDHALDKLIKIEAVFQE